MLIRNIPHVSHVTPLFISFHSREMALKPEVAIVLNVLHLISVLANSQYDSSSGMVKADMENASRSLNRLSQFHQEESRCYSGQGTIRNEDVAILTRINDYGSEDLSLECPGVYQTCDSHSLWDACRSSGSNHHFPGCDCSDDCHKFSSCCIHHKLDLVDKAVTDEITLNSCLQPPTDPDLQSFMVRSKCSFQWSTGDEINRGIKGMCEEKNETDYMRQILVTTINDGITYRNIFCLICNFGYENDHHVAFWNSTLVCDTQSSVDTTTGIITAPSVEVTQFLSSNERRNCGMIHHPPAFVYERTNYHSDDVLRYCYTSHAMISDCKLNWGYKTDYATYIQSTILCKTIQAPVMHVRPDGTSGESTVTFYRNKYCALCHDVNLKDVYCLNHMLPLNKLHKDPLQNILKTDERYDVATFSLSISDPQHKSCPSDQLLDPFYNSCRQVFCSLGHKCSRSDAFPLFNSFQLFLSFKLTVFLFISAQITRRT